MNRLFAVMLALAWVTLTSGISAAGMFSISKSDLNQLKTMVDTGPSYVGPARTDADLSPDIAVATLSVSRKDYEDMVQMVAGAYQYQRPMAQPPAREMVSVGLIEMDRATFEAMRINHTPAGCCFHMQAQR